MTTETAAIEHLENAVEELYKVPAASWTAIPHGKSVRVLIDDLGIKKEAVINWYNKSSKFVVQGKGFSLVEAELRKQLQGGNGKKGAEENTKADTSSSSSSRRRSRTPRRSHRGEAAAEVTEEKQQPNAHAPPQAVLLRFATENRQLFNGWMLDQQDVPNYFIPK